MNFRGIWIKYRSYYFANFAFKRNFRWISCAVMSHSKLLNDFAKADIWTSLSRWVQPHQKRADASALLLPAALMSSLEWSHLRGEPHFPFPISHFPFYLFLFTTPSAGMSTGESDGRGDVSEVEPAEIGTDYCSCCFTQTQKLKPDSPSLESLEVISSAFTRC